MPPTPKNFHGMKVLDRCSILIFGCIANGYQQLSAVDSSLDQAKQIAQPPIQLGKSHRLGSQSF